MMGVWCIIAAKYSAKLLVHLFSEIIYLILTISTFTKKEIQTLNV